MSIFQIPHFPSVRDALPILSNSIILTFPIIVLFDELGFLLNYLKYPGVSKDKQMVLGLMDTSKSPEIIELKGLRVLT